MKKVLQCGIELGTSCITDMLITNQTIIAGASWWAVKHTTSELQFDTYVNNKLLHGMPFVVAFYYQLHSLLFHYHFHVHYRTLERVCSQDIEHRIEPAVQIS